MTLRPGDLVDIVMVEKDHSLGLWTTLALGENIGEFELKFAGGIHFKLFLGTKGLFKHWLILDRIDKIQEVRVLVYLLKASNSHFTL